MDGENVVPLREAREQVTLAITRTALLHLAFSKTLVEELGEERGKELILKSIMEYGRRVGGRWKRGSPDLPKYGVYGRQSAGKVYDCVFARAFREHGELDPGFLYCYIDAAKCMARNPAEKLIHGCCAACGDDYCTFMTIATTAGERRDFANKDPRWKSVDPRLSRGVSRTR